MNHTLKFNAGQKALIVALLADIGSDGHTIFVPEVLKDFPAELRARFTRTYHSDGSPKGSITGSNGQLIDSLNGVYGLDVLRGICSDLGLGYEVKMGRGFQAAACTSAIEKWASTPTASPHTHLYMFLSDDNLSYSAWAVSEAEAMAAIRRANPQIGRLVFLGKQ